jgi:DNA mismatch repair protein MutS
MGRRLLKERLLYPEIDQDIIENRYNQIEILRNNKQYEHFIDYLSKIADLEKYNRLMSLELLKPNDFYLCYLSYDFIQLLLSKINEYPEIWNSYNKYHNDILKWKDYYAEIDSIFEWENFGKTTIMNEKSLFKNTYSSEMDEITNQIELIHLKYKLICKRFSNILSTDNSVKLDFNENFNWFLYTTNKRASTFKERLMNIGDKCINVTRENEKYYSFKKEDFSYKKKDNANTIINFDVSRELSTELVSLQKRLVNLNKKLWAKIMISLYHRYTTIFQKMNSFLSELDVSISNAKLSIENSYCRPEIRPGDKSYLEANDIRHPIVERINTDTEYITNDINLGIEDKDGILLYGTNACGKSTLMKSIGLNIIMAQAGLYVACSSFRYHPYKKIFTRILNNDNIFKSQSSFAVEVQELKHIFDKSDQDSLILGDELCSGTETVSAISIVSASIQTFSKNKSSFMITSHLHQLIELQKIKEISNLSIYHLKIDIQENLLIYNRKLSDGPGPSIYGLRVCEAMGISKEFMKLCNEAKKEICNETRYILNTKTSTYNSEIILDKCKICNSNAEETHHIKPQEDADENNIIESFHKNKKHNLIGLCKKCHADVTYHRLEIKGYIQTSDGIKLDYHYLKSEEPKKTKKKFDGEQIQVIKQYKNKGMKNTDIISILQLKHNLKISPSTLKKIFTDLY